MKSISIDYLIFYPGANAIYDKWELLEMPIPSLKKSTISGEEFLYVVKRAVL
jgi:hypothetical protein